MMLCVLALSLQADDPEAAVKRLTWAFKTAKVDAERLAAIDEAAVTRQLKVASKLTQIVAGPHSADVKSAAARAVGRIGDPKAGPGLMQVFNGYGALLGSENPRQADDQRVIEAIAWAFGRVRDRAATSRLVQLITKNNIPLIRESVIALGRTRDAAAIDQLVRLYRAATTPELPGTPNPRKPLIGATLKALRWITGRKHESADDWEKWWSGRTGFQPPPEETLAGLPPGTDTFAVYRGKGEVRTLAKFDVVILSPGNHAREELAAMPLALADGDGVGAALDAGFRGAVVAPEKADEARRKFPKAIVVVRTPTSVDVPAHALLVEGIDPGKPDATVLDDLKARRRRDGVEVLALFVKAKEGLGIARANGFLGYVAPSEGFDTIATDSLR